MAEYGASNRLDARTISVWLVSIHPGNGSFSVVWMKSPGFRSRQVRPGLAGRDLPGHD